MPKTLADMTPEEREACIGMWVKTPRGYGLLLDHEGMNGYYQPVVVMPSYFTVFDGRWGWESLELLPEMPRAWNPDGTPKKGKWDVEEITFRDCKGTVIASNAHRRWISEWEPVE